MTMPMSEQVAAVRRFNRFYTRRIGVLREGLLDTRYSLTEARVLFELAQRGECTATCLGRELDLDAGYLSRMLGKFQSSGLIARRRSEEDGRRRILSLTERGEAEFADLDRRQRDDVEDLLKPLTDDDQGRLVGSLHRIERLLDAAPDPSTPFVLRPHRPGDMGWVTYRHGVLYRQEYGWDERFEALVAHIVADFVDRFDPARERCWMAEMDGEIVGSVFLVRGEDDDTAKLRLLLVEPHARGHGLGAALIRECIEFSRAAGYQRLTLWTNSVLDAARHLYAKAGFEVIRREQHDQFGEDLVGEYWELSLRD